MRKGAFLSYFSQGSREARSVKAATGRRLQLHIDIKEILAEIEKDMLAQNLHCKFRTLSPTGNEAQPWRD